jgi:hypothetical protein
LRGEKRGGRKKKKTMERISRIENKKWGKDRESVEHLELTGVGEGSKIEGQVELRHRYRDKEIDRERKKE